MNLSPLFVLFGIITTSYGRKMNVVQRVPGHFYDNWIDATLVYAPKATNATTMEMGMFYVKGVDVSPYLLLLKTVINQTRQQISPFCVNIYCPHNFFLELFIIVFTEINDDRIIVAEVGLKMMSPNYFNCSTSTAGTKAFVLSAIHEIVP
uniref:Secreted protein n=1 Tax=Heterorhabditis bacteriophora TaxID=37862 RepID=A0A1I7WXH1_HETBA